jgi:hypothetical protein
MKRVAFAVLVLSLITSNGCGPGGLIDIVSPGQTPTIESFDASPLTIAAGQSSTLTWSVSGASTVSIDHGIGDVALSGSRIVSPTSTTVYTLTASGSNGKSVIATAEVTVSTAPTPTGDTPVISSFTSDPPAISYGNAVTLRWEVSGATSVSIEPGVGTVALSGSTSVSPSADTTYKLVASNAAGTATATVLVSVTGGSPAEPPVINEFKFTPSTIHPGESSTLSWDVTGATSVVLDRGIGSVAATGSRTVSVLATTNYTLTASNAYGTVSLVVPLLVIPVPDDASPDLIITSVARTAASGGYITTYTVKNQGPVNCPSSVAKLYANGAYRASDTVPTLPAGSAVTRQFSAWTFDPRTPVIKVVADAEDAVDESNEENNEKSVSIAVESVVNLVDSAHLAQWQTGSPTTTISFGGSLSDPDGFATYRTSVKLEDGGTYSRVLQTHPKWVASGWISGQYPSLTLPSGAWFVGDVGFLNGATGSDGATFRLWFLQASDDVPTLLGQVNASYDGDLDSFSIDLAPLAGVSGKFIFQVLAGSTSAQDWAVWVDAKVIK